MQCSQCGHSNLPDAQVCEACHLTLTPAERNCPECGAVNPASARFCNGCGHALGPSGARTAAIRSPSREYAAIAGAVIAAVALAVLALTAGKAPPDAATSATTAGTIRIVAILLSSMALGGAIACALLIDRVWRRYFVSAMIGVVAVLFYESAPTRPFTGNVPGDMAIAIAGVCFTTFIASSFFEGWTFGFSGAEARTNIRAIVMPQNWAGGTVSEPLSTRDLVSRWFVAVAASTGSVVGALMTQPAFWDALAKTLAPSRLIFTLLLMVVSVTLIGPLEEYIFGRRVSRRSETPGEAAPSPARGLFEDVWENFSPRAAGRLLLVLLFAFQPALLDACVGETVSRGDINATFLILTTAIGPALITYYWSAALQRGAPSIMRQSGQSSTVLSAILWYPPCLALLVSLGMAFAMSDPQNNGKVMIIVFLLGIPVAYGIALVWGFVLNGLSAYGGGWVLDRIRAQREMDTVKGVAMLAAVLALINLLFVVIGMLITMAFVGEGAKGELLDWSGVLLALLSTLGWITGLLVSGFPRILRGARNQPPPSADAPSESVAAA